MGFGGVGSLREVHPVVAFRVGMCAAVRAFMRSLGAGWCACVRVAASGSPIPRGGAKRHPGSLEMRARVVWVLCSAWLG